VESVMPGSISQSPNAMQVKPQQSPVEQNRPPRRRRFILSILTVLTAVAVTFLFLWHLLLPDPPASVPGTLTQRDQNQIARLCRQQTIHWALDRLKNGDFRSFRYGVDLLFRQKIDRFIDDRDGTYRIYVVVYDKSATDGFNPWSRHQVTRTNGLWTVLRSY
jgi:hypothetical protein